MGGRNRSLASTTHIVSAALAITLACRPELPAAKRYQTECANNPPGVDIPARLRDSIRHPSSYSGSRDIRSNAIARRFPTYAGYAYRGKFFVVWFTDTSVGRSQLDTVVRLENIENPDSLPFQVGQARWSYSQLYDWYYYLSPLLLRNNKVRMSGMDLYANRLIFHVSDTVVRHQADSQLVALNVPCGLVRLQLDQR